MRELIDRCSGVVVKPYVAVLYFARVKLIQPEEIAGAVVMFVQDEALAGRVMVWPDGGPRRLVPVDVAY